ncbi:MAG TPA: PatB family C-S lyase [Thiobacillaceae bacterium]|nr:PatB family C-S lyase [Thiobacillaceae bacterium]HNU65113.1 PatB family C-S lyase [Thiobacillaceae bacterium]
MSYDFDTPVSRLGSHSVKYDQRQARFGRGDVLPLWVADMDLAAPACVRRALAARVAHPIYGYTHTDAEVYEAILDWQWRRHGWRVQPEWIVLLPGVVPGLDLCVQSFTQPGEAIVVQPPVYNPFFESALRNERRVLRNPLVWNDCRHGMDLARLAADLGAHCRLLHLCNPHNPGGRVWRRDELTALGEIVLRHDLVLVSDEIHADLVFPGHRHVPLASLAPELAQRTITLNSPGKTFNTAGLHTAYAIIPNRELRACFHAGVRRLHLEGANLLGLVALKTAYREGEAWLGALLDYLQGNLEHACRHIHRHLPLVACRMPEATFLLWLDCRAWCRTRDLDDDALHRHLVDAGLGLTPGTQFGTEGSGFMRMNVALPRARLDEALARLARALA